MYQHSQKLQNCKWSERGVYHETHSIVQRICQSYLVALNTISLLDPEDQWLVITPRGLAEVFS